MTRWPEASICAVMSLRSAFLAICLVALSTVTFAADPRVIETPQATPSAGVPPSTPSDQEKKSPGQHNTTQDNRGTEAVPLIVKELPRELSEKEKREAETKSILDHRLIEGTENLAKYTEYLFFATIMLAAGSGVLALVAYCQMRDARRAMSAAEASAKATERFAAISEREFVVAHRPKVILREAIIGSVLEGQPIAVIFTLANVGETPGTIVQSQVGVEIVNERVERPFFLGSVEPYNELGLKTR